METDEDVKVLLGKWEDRRVKSEAEATVKYNEIMLVDAGKTYTEILPKDFNPTSYIGKQVMSQIDMFHNFINTCPLYKGQVFTKENVVHYMLSYFQPLSFYLAEKFIHKPNSTDLLIQFIKLKKDSGTDVSDESFSENFEKFEATQNITRDTYNDLDKEFRYLEDIWSTWKQRTAIKNRTADFEIEEDGFPRQGRGNMCYAYHPIQGDIRNLEIGKTYTCTNPRSKKEVELTILSKRGDQSEYKCLLKGKEIFICEYGEVEECYSCLHPINKVIWSGWWNRTLIIK